MLNPINIAKSSAQFIYTNSTSAVTGIASSVNKVFNSTINKFIDTFNFTNNTIQSVGTLISTKTNGLINYLSILVFGEPKTELILLKIKEEKDSVLSWDNHRRSALNELEDEVRNSTCKNFKDLFRIIDTMVNSFNDISSLNPNKELNENKKSALIRFNDNFPKKMTFRKTFPFMSRN